MAGPEILREIVVKISDENEEEDQRNRIFHIRDRYRHLLSCTGRQERPAIGILFCKK